MEKIKSILLKQIIQRKYSVVFVTIIVAALFCELFIFNFKWINSAFSDETIVTSYNSSSITKQGDKLLINDDNAVLTIRNIDRKVKYLRISLDKNAAQKANISISATDEANANYLTAPERTVISGIKQSQYIRLHFSGKIKNLKITIRGMDGERVDADFIGLNAHVPLMFSWLRFIFLILAAMILYILRPKSSVYEYKTDLTRPNQKIAVLAFVIIYAAITFNMIHWNGTATIYHEIMPHHRQYYELVDAFKHGHAYIDDATGQLQSMENPYDIYERARQTNGYRWDTAYYNGKYYCYFGAAPAVLFYLPYNLITGRDLPNYIALYIFSIIAMIGILLLLWEIIKKWYPDTPFAVYLMLSGVFSFISYTAYTVYKPDLYMIPTVSALMFAILGLAFWLSAERKNETGDTVLMPSRLAIGSACAAITAGCRPQFLISAVLGVMLFWDYAFKKRELFSKKSIKQTVAVCLPFAVVGAILMAYNFARFGSPFDFGANYNLTTNDMTHRGFVFGRIGLGIFTYFLQPFRMNSIFPFIHDFGSETVYQGLTLTENLMGGVLWLYPILIIGVIGAFKRNVFGDKRAYRLVYFSVIMAVVVAIMDAQMAGLLTRYFNDFVWLMMLASAVTIFALYDKCKSQGIIKLTLIVSAVTLIIAFLTIFAHEENSIREAYPQLYYTVQHLTAFWM